MFLLRVKPPRRACFCQHQPLNGEKDLNHTKTPMNVVDETLCCPLTYCIDFITSVLSAFSLAFSEIPFTNFEAIRAYINLSCLLVPACNFVANT
jgi:hypothetical protein